MQTDLTSPDQPDVRDQAATDSAASHAALSVALPESLANRRQQDFCELLGGLIDTFEKHFASLAVQSNRTVELLQRLMERANANAEDIRLLREKTANLPDIAAATAESLGNMQDRLESIEERITRSGDQGARTTRDLDDIRNRLEQLGQAAADCQEACADVAGRQEQIISLLGDAREAVERNAAVLETNSTAIMSLAQERTTCLDELQNHISEKCNRLATRNMIALLLSAIAAIAAITAAVLVILEHP